MLNEREWNTINTILLELYMIDDVQVLFQKIMKIIQMLIPYSQGFAALVEKDQTLKSDSIYCIHMDENTKNSYIEKYYDEDYLKYLFEFAEDTVVYRDTDILEDHVRKETIFYKKFLKPLDIPYGCGVLLIKNGTVIGIINLFRKENLKDFSDKEIYILNILKKHLLNIVSRTLESQQHKAAEQYYINARKEYEFTNREQEIVKLLCSGYSNSEICEQLMISVSTVKKHVYNIYEKTHVNSRAQLINKIYSYQQ